jgi:bifunctional DNase/RNase
MANIQLRFQTAAEVNGKEQDGLLLLSDQEQQRQLVITCSRKILQEITESKNNDTNNNDDIVKILWEMIHWQTTLELSIHINTLEDGVYKALLINEENQFSLPIKADTAILLSIVSHNEIPIYMDAALFRRQSSVYQPNAKGLQLPLNIISEPMLHDLLDNAVKAERYEIASELRDELKKREEEDKRRSQESKDEAEDAQ